MDWSPQAGDNDAGTELRRTQGLVSSGELDSNFMTFVFMYFVLSVCSKNALYMLLQLNEFDEASATK